MFVLETFVLETKGSAAGDMSGTISGKTTRATRTARIRLFDCALMLIFAFLLGILWGTTTTPTYYQVIKLEKLGE